MAVHQASSPTPWPPILFSGAVVVGGLTHWRAPVLFFPEDWRFPAAIAGAVAFVAGFALLATATRKFAVIGTPIAPNQPTKFIVSGGVYDFSRNPMYLGMVLMLLGLGLVSDSLWLLLLVPFSFYAVTKLAIEREEAYLAKRFGQEYLEYKRRVRRWI